MPCTGFCASCPRGSLPGTERRPSEARGPSDGDAKPGTGSRNKTCHLHLGPRSNEVLGHQQGQVEKGLGFPGLIQEDQFMTLRKRSSWKILLQAGEGVTAPGVPDSAVLGGEAPGELP